MLSAARVTSVFGSLLVLIHALTETTAFPSLQSPASFINKDTTTSSILDQPNQFHVQYNNELHQSRKRPSPLFSADEGSDKPTRKQNRENLRLLGRLSGSGLLAYGFMRYYALVSLFSLSYYGYQKLVVKKEVQNGEVIMVFGIIGGLALLKKLLDPAKFVLELLVTTFFSYFFITLANGDL